MAGAEILEREPLLAELGALLESARGGEGRVALVAGEAGIGKTALLEHFARRRAQPPIRVLWGGCDALFTPRPLAPFQEIAWQLGGEVAERFQAGAPRDVLFHSFYEALRPPSAPALVVVEDVHWADEATLDLLRFLGRRAQRTCALLAVTYRDDEVGEAHPLRPLLGDLSRGAARAFRPPPLSAAAVRLLAERAGRDPEGLHRVTGGNPFFVTEVLASGGGVPATVRDAVLARAARLSPPARELLDIASVVPSRIELGLLEKVAGPSAAALDEVLASGMLVLADEAAAFRHELARRAVEDSLPPLRRKRLHARILELLGGAGRPGLARLVHHAEGAGDVEAVLRLAPEAAEQADRVGAHREAATLLGAALRHAERLTPERRAALLEQHSYQCQIADRIAEALASRRAALELWRQLGEPLRVGDSLRWLSRLSWLAGRNEEARRYVEEALATLEPLPRSRELAMAYSSQAQLHMLAAEVAEAISWGTKALVLARELGDVETEAHALNNVGTAECQVGEPAGWEKLRESLRLSLEHGFEEHAARAYTNLATTAMELHEPAEGWLGAGIEYASRRDLDSLRLYMLAWRARLRNQLGQWDEAEADAALVLDHPDASQVNRIPALTALGLARARRGDLRAGAALDEGRRRALETGESQRIVPVAAARAEAAWLDGDLARSLAEASAAIGICAGPAMAGTGLQRAWFLGRLGIWIWRAGGSPPAVDEVAGPFALQLAGDWRGAAAAWERLGCPYEAALACHEGDDPDALRAALGTLETLGARPAAERMRRRLAELGAGERTPGAARPAQPAAPPPSPEPRSQGAAAPGARGTGLDLSVLLRDLAGASDEDSLRAWEKGLGPGQVVGRFEILHEIGRGGFGAVYAALDTELGRTVAFKILRPARSRHELSEDWIGKEAVAVARLDHPSIVTLFDVGSCPSGPYLVEELLRGTTLAERLARGPLPGDQALEVAVQIAGALAHAHSRGVLHRDLKPGNVFLTEGGRVKLLDFGLAHLLGTRGAPGAGTPAYMAPEQALGEAVDERADVFAAGAVLFEALAGRRPFEVEEGRTTALRRGSAPRLPASAPRALARAVAAALARDPADRPRNGQAWLESLLLARRSLERARLAGHRALGIGLGLALTAGLVGAILWGLSGR